MRSDQEARIKRLLERRKAGAATVPEDPIEFFTLAHGGPPIEWQRRFLRSPSTRILLNLTRQGGKSLTTATYAVHKAITSPGALVLIGAPGTRQSTELLTKTRRIYQSVGSPMGYEGDSMTRLEFGGSRIVALPANAGLIRGFSGPSVILLDEASRIPDDVIDAVTPMMASNPSCRLVCMSTPAGTRGFWWDLWENGGDRWERYETTADEIPWITEEFLEEERSRMTEAIFLEEYYGKPYASSAAVFSQETIQKAIRPGFSAWKI